MHRALHDRIPREAGALALVEDDREAVRHAVVPAAAALQAPRVGEVPGAGAVARFAPHAQLGPPGVEAVSRRDVALAVVGDVALRAPGVPVLRAAGPVQLVAGRDRLVGVEMEPALPTERGRPRVPDGREHLIAAAGERRQVLLERPDAERVRDRVVRVAGVGSLGALPPAAVATEQSRRVAEVDHRAAREVAEHRGGVGNLHGALVVGALPAAVLVRMAVGAGGAAHVGGGRDPAAGRREVECDEN